MFAPLAQRRRARARRPRTARCGAKTAAPAVYLYTNEANEGAAYHARMFGLGWGISEDPATGSAASAFAGVVMKFDPPGDGEHTLVIEQGVEMGRPSAIALGLEVEGGELRAATIGGSAVIVGQGTLDL